MMGANTSITDDVLKTMPNLGYGFDTNFTDDVLKAMPILNPDDEIPTTNQPIINNCDNVAPRLTINCCSHPNIEIVIHAPANS